MSNGSETATVGGTYVDVILDAPSRQLDRPFTYVVPPHLEEKTEIGSVVLVPFLNTLHVGYVIRFREQPDLPRIRPIDAVVDEPPLFDAQTVELCTWMARHYLSSISQALRLIVPPGRARRVIQLVELVESGEETLRKLSPRADLQRELVRTLAAGGGSASLPELRSALNGRPISSALRALEKRGFIARRFVLAQPRASRIKVRMVEITAHGKKALAEDKEMDKRSPARRRLLRSLLDYGGKMTAHELQRRSDISSQTLKSALELGLVRTWDEERLRDPFAGRSFPYMEPHRLNPQQEACLKAIVEGMERGGGEIFLLHGITGSGKTEIYLHAINHALSKGRTAIVLVPEIALTPQMIQRFKGRLGEEVAVLHSRLGLGERYDQWRGIREGRYRVVVGARSALFAPLPHLGLLIIDEEHENSYKEGSAPRYLAADVAAKKAQIHGAVLVLGSATPRLETQFAAEQGRFRYLELPKRIDNRPLPLAEVVDMREMSSPGERTILSPQLVNALAGVYKAGEQAVLFLNRRGFAPTLQCHRCGHIFKCPNCSVGLCYHSKDPHLLCHHCNWRLPPPFTCPQCGNQQHRYAGVGTERVEAELKRLLPSLRCVRMDADTTRRKDAHWDLLEYFKAGKAQVLLGTQMIAKGLDIPNVTLVGVINADTSLSLPDFRAGERTFQLLTQVSGRAGRGRRPGRVIIQSHCPEHYAVQAAVAGDARTFYEQEISFRREANYPPFCRLANLVITSSEEEQARSAAEGMGEILRETIKPGLGELLGPAPAPLSRLKGKFRYHLTIKSRSLHKLSVELEDSLLRFESFRASYCRRHKVAKEDLALSVDVDPVTLL